MLWGDRGTMYFITYRLNGDSWPLVTLRSLILVSYQYFDFISPRVNVGTHVTSLFTYSLNFSGFITILTSADPITIIAACLLWHWPLMWWIRIMVFAPPILYELYRVNKAFHPLDPDVYPEGPLNPCLELPIDQLYRWPIHRGSKPRIRLVWSWSWYIRSSCKRSHRLSLTLEAKCRRSSNPPYQ